MNKRLTLSAEKSNMKSEKLATAIAELKKTQKLEREAMERKRKEDIALTLATADKEHEKEIKAMEKRHSRQLEKLNTTVSKKDRKLAKLKEKKKGQASAAQSQRWDNHTTWERDWTRRRRWPWRCT